jgi:hypothetical protein
MTVHGVSMSHMLRIMGEYPCGLILITDMNDQQFGGFVSQPFVSNAQARNSYYGSGECFVFKLIKKSEEEIRRESLEVEYTLNLHERVTKNHQNNITSSKFDFTKSAEHKNFLEELSVDEYRVAIYHWQGDNDFFMFTGDSPTFIAMGGGSPAFQLDSDFRKGTSANCITFRSPVLASKSDFFVKRFEVFAPIRSVF